MSLLASLLLLATAPATAALPDMAAPALACDALAGEEVVAVATADSCRVSGHLHPVTGSDIGFALWLPARWNGRFLMLGNGGYASAMPLAQMARALAKGYAVAATDTGHQGDDPSFALGHPEAIVDWGWRAVHETARKAPSLTRAYYGRAPRWRYFNGCSTGGHQALSEAQRFPHDFDGLVAGAPGYDRVRLNAGFLWMFLSNHRRGDNLHPILGQSQLDLLARHALLRCGKHGARWLDHPGACHADPGALLCRPRQHAACLTAEQVAAARAIYAGPHDERHRPVFFGQAPGTERQWSLYWSDPRNGSIPMRASFWQVWAGEGQGWNWWTFSFGRDLDRARERLSATVDADSADLSALAAAGGKLLQWHGLADPVVPFADTLAYRARVRARMGNVSHFYRLSLLAGVGHCGGGPRQAVVDMQKSMEAWVETGHPAREAPVMSRRLPDE
ncbi:tannase/feruloyl esterase family alpha/beta hydrolase [Novosphingobium rosa]|uniref:tannase/feruloyl esterase family alpha/beta hydrolase n=1 Tax=Novosphingobium rosa TaxID=76978 RepID=UPI000831BCA7|nr:tannase/feruloyl esterase family alpha/beta hydrolase [Novosphingobium rosa]